MYDMHNINGLVQNCSNSIANAVLDYCVPRSLASLHYT